jgi:hypothetical protein
MTESNEKTKAPAEKKDQQKQTLSGTGSEKEPSVWEKAAETIAGDNKLMGVALKIILSPITLIAGAGALIWCFFKIKGLKEEVEKLKTENKKFSDEKIIQDEEYHRVKKKYKKLKELNETDQESNVNGLGFIPHQLFPGETAKKKTYNTAYLD